MIDEIDFGSDGAIGFADSVRGLHLAESFTNLRPIDEAISSIRTSNRTLRRSLIDYSSAKRENDLKLVQIPPTPIINASDTDNVSADLKKYFFDKMEKKGIKDSKRVYDQYLEAGLSQKAAIALTDRNFFPKPHEKDHGTYLKNVIGEAVFKEEQAARKGKNDWTVKTNSTATRVLATSTVLASTFSKSLKQHEYRQEGGSIGGYLLGIAQIVAGGAIIATGATLEVLTVGGFTVGLGITVGTGATLIGTGLATTASNAKNISMPKLPKYDPLQDIFNKVKDKPKKWNEIGAPPVRGDELVGDGKTCPGQGFNEWKGNGSPQSGKGSWIRGSGENIETLHPDFEHPIHGPHWDYEGPSGESRIYPNGTWEPK